MLGPRVLLTIAWMASFFAWVFVRSNTGLSHFPYRDILLVLGGVWFGLGYGAANQKAKPAWGIGSFALRTGIGAPLFFVASLVVESIHRSWSITGVATDAFFAALISALMALSEFDY